MSFEVLKRFCDKNGIVYRENELMSAHTTFSIGGAATLFVETSGSAASEMIKLVNELGIKFFVLGNGSNVLFPDSGFDGVVLHFGRGFSDIKLNGDTLECGSGASLTAIARAALEHGLAGLEFAYGIPGSLGGGVYMNAGAYGGELKDVLVSSSHIGADGSQGIFSGEEMGLSYRHSAYRETDLVITGALLKLRKGSKDEIQSKMQDYMNRRREKQPIDVPSAGSTFKRPDGAFAAALIDECGLKGRRIGGAMVSEKHAGFVVNAGGATSSDVLRLIELIRDEVFRKTGFSLETEIRIV